MVRAGSTATFSVNTPIPAGSGIQVVLSSWTESNGAQIEQKATVSMTMSRSFSIRANWITQYQVNYAISGNTLQIDAPSTEWVNTGAKPNGVFPATAINAAKDAKCVLISDDRPYAVNGPLTITASYQTQYLVTFSQIGIEADSTGIIAIILGDEKPYQMLANATWTTRGSSIDFTYSEIVESTNTSKKYILIDMNYSSPLTIEEPITVLGIYESQISSSLSLNTITLYVIPFYIPPPIVIVLLAFRKRKKKITPISTSGGVISPSTPQKIEPGGDSTVFIITAYPGYKIDAVVIDDATHLGAIRTYKFIEVNRNHTISAVFSKN